MFSSSAWAPETAPQRVEDVLKRIANDPLTDAVFIKPLPERARTQAKAAASKTGPLSGALISIKALFDLKGEVSTAGSPLLINNPPASEDAPCIANLDAAGGVFVGISNEPQLSYSGLGQNPSFGTPKNALDPARVPGGSSSGAAVSVALGLCDIAIGSDTGGSIRLPAAFNGIVGFKPTQASVSRKGGVALSQTLDSFGPLAKSVSDCELAWQIMAGRDVIPCEAALANLQVASNYGFDDLQPIVRDGFEALLSALREAKVPVREKDLSCMDIYANIERWQISAVEGRALFEEQFQSQKELFDPKVYARFARADNLSAVDYRRTVNLREELVEAFSQELGDGFVILPTSPALAPDLSVLDDPDEFNTANMRASRNTAFGNIADACGLALPFKFNGEVLSLMVLGPKGQDAKLLACGKALEPILAGL
ncbi:MAG: amidase [Rhodobacteraceae bacterium]|nr:amidase [Paracoccaceae bacterium]